MNQPTAFYNTIGLTGQELKQAVVNAATQEACIMLIYKNTRTKYTPWDIHSLCLKAGKKWPITSCRRAITNLMNKGELTKMSERKAGEYNTPEHFYHLNFHRYPAPQLKQPELFQ